MKTGGTRANARRALVGLLVVAIAAAVFMATEAWLRREGARAAERRAHDIASRLRTGLATPVEALHALRAFVETPRVGLSHADFQAFCRPALARHASIVALEWFPLVERSQRAQFERYVRREQTTFAIREPTRAGDMVVAVERDVHVPLTYSEPFTAVVHGLDLAFDAQRVEPVWRALDSGRVTLSDRYQLVEDPPTVFSVVAYAPVTSAHWVGDPSAAGSSFQRGVVVALFRLNRLVESSLAKEEFSDVGLLLRDPSAPPELSVLYQSQPKLEGSPFAARVSFVDKVYELVVYTPAPTMHGASWVALLATLLGGAALASYFGARRRAAQLERTVARLGVYQLEGRIASGGMGTVYKARHALLKRPTAIKIAHAGYSEAHFEREVLLTSALNHPNTVLVYDYGVGEEGAFYYAMEYIEGYDLEQLVRLTGPLPPGRVIRILLQVAGSLDEAHRRGLVHRDIKPSNVMVTERGGLRDFVKVLDFGLAKDQHVAGAEGGSVEGSFAFAGTPGYVAPEVLGGAAATAQSDAFSFGCVAYFLLAGKAPFSGSSATESLTRVLTAQPAPLSEAVPTKLSELVRACLSKKPEARPQSLAAVAERLRHALVEAAPWTQQDAESWWDQNPPPTNLAPSEGPLTFLLRQRRSRSGSSRP